MHLTDARPIYDVEGNVKYYFTTNRTELVIYRRGCSFYVGGALKYYCFLMLCGSKVEHVFGTLGGYIQRTTRPALLSLAPSNK